MDDEGLFHSVLKVKNKSNFRVLLDQLDEEQLRTLYSCFSVVKQSARTKREKKALERYRGVINAAKAQHFHVQRAKVFLFNHFPVLKRIVATLSSCLSCISLANKFCQDEDLGGNT